MRGLPFSLFLGIELLLRTNQLTQPVDIFCGFNACREVLEAVSLIWIQRFIHFVELHFILYGSVG